MKKRIRLLLKISIHKTLRLNYHYFGFKAIFFPKILIARNVSLSKLRGKIIISSNFIRGHIGFATNYIYYGKKMKTTFFNDGTIFIDGNFCISEGCSIVVKKNAILSIGSGVHISQNTQIECHKRISLGNKCVISWECLIIDSDTHPIYDFDKNLINPNKDIVLSDGVWVCCRCTILKGAFLQKDNILASNSILTKKIFEENVIVHNNNIIKRNIVARMDDDIL